MSKAGIPEEIKQQVNAGNKKIDVRLRNWYPAAK